MSTFPEQLSAAGRSQVAAQLAFLQDLAARAVENTGKIAALNLNASRASLEKSSTAMFQMMAAQDPRDLLALGAQGQQQLEGMLAYTRALFGIVTASAAPAGPALRQPVPAAAAAPMTAPEAAPQPAAHAAPPAKATPIAEAAEKVAAAEAPAKPAAAPVPAADSPVVVKGLKAVEAAPPPAPVSGTPKLEPKRAAAASKSAKKK